MSINNFKLSLVIPWYNEEELVKFSLDTIIQKLTEYSIADFEIICVNDGSKDNTLQLLSEYADKNSKIKVISLAANRGQQIAFFTGMCYSTGDAVVLMDADLQDPPECIPSMIQKWKEGFDVVYGKRNVREGESFIKKITAFAFYRILNNVSFTDIPQDVGEFRLMDKRVVKVIINMPERNRFNRAIVSWLGFKQYELLFDRPERMIGETKFGMKEMINLAKDGIFSFSYFPIKIVQGLGLSSIIVSSFLLVYVLFSKLFLDVSSGCASLMLVIIFFSGTILFSLGIIGEYIARIHTESLERPIFIAELTKNIDQDFKLPNHIQKFH